MMATSFSKQTLSRRAGRATARVWCWLVQLNRQVTEWMVAAGLPRLTAQVLGWSVKLLIVGIMLHLTVWIAAVLIGLVFASWIAANAIRQTEDDQPQWKDGLLGFGLYDCDGFRVDLHDPDKSD